jgi:5,6,7,8-tetrahydromethanopterin hydro-lyase
VASGVLDALVDGTVAPASVDELVLVAAVWVASGATDPDAVYRFNRDATRDALRAGALRHPSVGDVLAVRDEPFNAYWLPESMR